MKLNGIDINLKSIRTLSKENLLLLCDNIRKEIISKVSLNGGHLSSNLGVVELEVALCSYFDFTKDIILFDVGHQAYPYKIINGEDLSFLRKENGPSGFNKFGQYESGHSSTAISSAVGFSKANNKKNVVVVIGDGAISSGLSFEGLNDITNNNAKIIIVLNDNGKSISKTVGALNDQLEEIKAEYLPLDDENKKKWRNNHSRNIFECFGLNYIPPVDGHNIDKLKEAFEEAKNSSKSTLIHVVTKKGKGLAEAENDVEGYSHNVKNFDAYSPSFIPSNDNSYSSFVSSLLEEKMLDEDTYVICPSMLVGCKLEKLHNKYPSRCIDVGICENHAINLATGLIRENKKCYVVTYSSFFQRAYDNIFVDCALKNLNITLLIDRSGLCGEDGESHQGIYDGAYLSTIPNTSIAVPSCKETLSQLMDLKVEGVYALRYSKTLVPSIKRNELNVKYGKWVKEYENGNETIVITNGYLLSPLLNKIKEASLKLTLINALFIQPIDKEALKACLNAKKIYVFDGMGVKNELVSKIEEFLFENKYKGEFFQRSIPLEFIKQGSISQQLSRYKLDENSIFDVLKDA